MVDARAGAAYEVEPDLASRQAVISAIIWLLVTVTMGVVLHLRALFPDFLAGIELLSYGRLRAVFENVLVFGWLTTIGFAAVFALLPRLAMAQLHNEVLGAASIVFWNLVLFVGIAALLLGMNEGRLLAELPFGVGLALLAMMVLVLYNAGVTVVRRREVSLYISAWYLLAAALLFPIIYVIGNIPVFGGVMDGIVNGFYLNAVELLWLLPVGLGIAYYVVPVDTGNPLASTLVARTGFWVLMFAGGWTGQRYLVKGPGPDYLEAMAVAMTFVLLVPVLSAVSNLFATGRDRWGLLGQAYGLRFAAAGLAMLVVWITLVVVGTVPMVSRLVGLTTWTSGVRHLAMFGVFSSFAFALIYHLFPLLVGRDWFSRPAASFHFWVTLVGTAVGSAAMLFSGVVSGAIHMTWARAGDGERFAEFTQWLAISQRGFAVVAAVAFVFVAVAQYVFAVNAWRTSRQGPILRVAAPAAVPVGSSV